MSRTRNGAALLAIGLVSALLLASCTVPTREVHASAASGFGDLKNSYSWSMAWFKGQLYVGTGRDQYCFEQATEDFFFPGQFYTSPHPPGFPEIYCPPDPYDMDLRAEIWQFTPAYEGEGPSTNSGVTAPANQVPPPDVIAQAGQLAAGTWKMVYISPVVANPREAGKKVALDIGYRGMYVQTEANGTQALYIAGVSADEIIPELHAKHPPRILRTTDGVHYSALPGNHGTIYRYSYGTQLPMGYRDFVNYNGKLIVSASGGLTGDGALLQIVNPTSRTPKYVQITPPNLNVFEEDVFNGALYVGAGDATNGYSVWKGTSPPGSTWVWTPVVQNGAGRGKAITSVVSMHEFKGDLYVGASGWGGSDVFPSSELIRIAPDDSWQVVVGSARVADGQMRNPISGLQDGFGNLFNAHFWRQVDSQGQLLIGTNDWSYALRDWPIIGNLLRPYFGFDIYGSCDGQFWSTITDNAFGDGLYNFGLRTFADTPAGVFMGSANHVQGTEVWQDTTQNPCGTASNSSPANGATTAAASAGSLSSNGTLRVLADSQTCGTVVSWEKVPGASSYRVVRTSYKTVDVPVPQRPNLPTAGGVPDVLTFSASPAVAPVQMADAQTVIGTTAGDAVVDPSAIAGQRYQYEVVAEDASGRALQNGIDEIPSQRPPASLADLQAAIGKAVSNGGSPQLRVALSNINGQWQGGSGLSQRGLLEKVQQAVAADGPSIKNAAAADEIGDIAYRLGRQIDVADQACR